MAAQYHKEAAFALIVERLFYQKTTLKPILLSQPILITNQIILHNQDYPTPQNNKNTLLLTVLIVLVSLLVVALGVGAFLYMNNKSTEEKLHQQSQIEQLKVSQDSLKNVNKVLQTSVNKKPKKHPTPYPQGTFNLSGKIGKYPIRMTLKINGNDIKGAYYYVKSGDGSTLDLYGEAHGQNLSIYEIEQTEGCTGAFDGTFDGINFDGTFINGKGQQFRMSLEAE